MTGYPRVLFAGDPAGPGAERPGPPEYLTDLNLDQVAAGMTEGRARYRLEEYFHAPLRDARLIIDRQLVIQDLRRGDLQRRVAGFGQAMDRVRRYQQQAAAMRYPRQAARWQLDSQIAYITAVDTLLDDLTAAELRSRGLRAVRDWLTRLRTGPAFLTLRADSDRVLTALDDVRYRLHINGNRIHVTHDPDQSEDYSAAVRATFHRFRQGAVPDRRIGVDDQQQMDHVQAGVLDLVAQLYPDVFTDLDRVTERHQQFLDPAVVDFDRDIRFPLAYLDYIAPLTRAGLNFCLPTFGAGKEMDVTDTFDLALARVLHGKGTQPVTNDITLCDGERIMVVTGPNNGGKTTFARTIGQLHHLARLGLPVPGRTARLSLCDRVFTHFERLDAPATLRGTLHNDLLRVHDILDHATGDSVVILNELFTSTTLQDAVALGSRIMRELVEKDLIAVYVTFIDELADHGPSTVSLVAVVPPDDPTTRTFRIMRRRGDGNAHALALAHRFGLTYPQLTRRLAS